MLCQNSIAEQKMDRIQVYDVRETKQENIKQQKTITRDNIWCGLT